MATYDMTRTNQDPRAADEVGEVVATVIRSRRTIHLFDESRRPPGEEILAGIDLARWAPNHYLTEPWHFYLLGREAAEAIARMNAQRITERRGAEAGEIKLKRWLGIPGWLVVTCRISEDAQRQREDYAACCCAIQNLQLYLWSRGIGTKWTTGDVIRDPGFYDLVGIDAEHETVVAMLWYGYAAEVPSTARKPVKEILTRRP